MARYFCGATYTVKAKANGEYEDVEPFFGMVSPSHGEPYVTDTREKANRLFRLTQHHSALYELPNGSTVATRVAQGECDAPITVELSPEQLQTVRQASIWGS